MSECEKGRVRMKAAAKGLADARRESRPPSVRPSIRLGSLSEQNQQIRPPAATEEAEMTEMSQASLVVGRARKRECVRVCSVRAVYLVLVGASREYVRPPSSSRTCDSARADIRCPITRSPFEIAGGPWGRRVGRPRTHCPSHSHSAVSTGRLPPADREKLLGRKHL